MRVKHIIATVVAITLSTISVTSFAEGAGNNDGSHNWMPQQPNNTYWQTPNWSSFNMPPAYNSSQPQQNYNNYRPPAMPAHRQAPPPAPNSYRGYNQQQPPNRVNNYRPPMNPNSYRGGNQPSPRGPYNNSNNRPDNGASAYNIPGYNRNRNNNSGWNNMWGNNNNNNFWGNSGPRTWTNPSKNNMEQGWDDMMKAPSRMGEMPGGWTAPEVTMPNPIDVGDQFQDNVKDLPEQIRNMDVGN